MEELPIPKEPVSIKKHLRNLIEDIEERRALGRSLGAIIRSAISQSRLNSYLWNEWKPFLKGKGWTWQEFQKAFFIHTVAIEKWARVLIPWQNLIQEIERELEAMKQQ